MAKLNRLAVVSGLAHHKLVVVGAVLSVLLTKPVMADVVTNLFVFGDSTVDTGWYLNQFPGNPTLKNLAQASAQNGGRIPNTPYGQGAAQVLAAHYGLTANPANQPGGTNYAAGGAQINAAFINPAAPSVASQITSYLSAHGGHADPNALYLFSAGGNDIKYANNLYFANGGVPVQPGQNGSPQAAVVAGANWLLGAASAGASALQALQAAGATKIIVSHSYNTTGIDAGYYNYFYSNFYKDLQSAGVQYKVADVLGLQRSIFADPGAYGFTSISNVDGPNGTALINPNPALIPNSWAYYGTPSLLRSPTAAYDSFWADNEHLAAHAQLLEGNLFIQVAEGVPEPATWAMMILGMLGVALVRLRTKVTHHPSCLQAS